MTYLPNLSREEPHVDGDLECYFNSYLWQLCPFILHTHAAAAVVEELGWDRDRDVRTDPDGAAVLNMVVEQRARARTGRYVYWPHEDNLTDTISDDPWHKELFNRWRAKHCW